MLEAARQAVQMASDKFAEMLERMPLDLTLIEQLNNELMEWNEVLERQRRILQSKFHHFACRGRLDTESINKQQATTVRRLKQINNHLRALTNVT